jgi:hypothetical protein
VEDYGATVSVAEALSWDEPAPPVPEMKAEPEVSAWDVPSWDTPAVSIPEVKAEPDTGKIPAWDVPVSEIRSRPVSEEAGDYEKTMAVFTEPESPVKVQEDEDRTVFSRRAKPEPAPVEEQTVAVVRTPAEPEPVEITGKDTLFPPKWLEPELTARPVISQEPAAPVRPVPPVDVRTEPVRRPEPVKPAVPVAAPVESVRRPEPVKPAAPVAAPAAPVRRPEPVKPAAPAAAPVAAPSPQPPRGPAIAVKPKPATPTPVDMKTPEVPDYGRSLSAEECDFTLIQQWNWLDRISKVIPTLRMGTEPSCVDFPLTIKNMKAAGDMRITVRQVAMRVGTMLSITNLENAITCEDVEMLRATSQILTAYGKMVSGRQADAIRMTVRYLGVRVAELKMR